MRRFKITEQFWLYPTRKHYFPGIVETSNAVEAGALAKTPTVVELEVEKPPAPEKPAAPSPPPPPPSDPPPPPPPLAPPVTDPAKKKTKKKAKKKKATGKKAEAPASEGA